MSIRIWGYEQLAPVRSFLFDLLLDGCHMKAPLDLSITTVNVLPGTPIHSVQASLGLSFDGSFGQMLQNAPESEIGQHVYLVQQGLVLRFAQGDRKIDVQFPVHPYHPSLHIPVAATPY